MEAYRILRDHCVSRAHCVTALTLWGFVYVLCVLCVCVCRQSGRGREVPEKTWRCLPAVRWVRADLGIHESPHLPSGRTCPADLWDLPHRRYPGGCQRSHVSLASGWESERENAPEEHAHAAVNKPRFPLASRPRVHIVKLASVCLWSYFIPSCIQSYLCYSLPLVLPCTLVMSSGFRSHSYHV